VHNEAKSVHPACRQFCTFNNINVRKRLIYRGIPPWVYSRFTVGYPSVRARNINNVQNCGPWAGVLSTL